VPFYRKEKEDLAFKIFTCKEFSQGAVTSYM